MSRLHGTIGLTDWRWEGCSVGGSSFATPFKLVGYSIEADLGRGLRILMHGDYAVDVFILLSGFVIHKLWHDAREPYRIFIARRFLHLWPAYAVRLLGALALRPCLAPVSLCSCASG